MSKVFLYIVFASIFFYGNCTKITMKEDNTAPSRDLMVSGSEDPTVVMPDLMEIMSDCNETFRTQTAYLESLNESGSFPDESDSTPKCYIRCVLEKAGIVSEDGQFSPDLTAQVFASPNEKVYLDDVQKMATVCAKNRNESCRCERSYRFMKCLMESDINNYMKIM